MINDSKAFDSFGLILSPQLCKDNILTRVINKLLYRYCETFNNIASFPSYNIIGYPKSTLVI